MTLRELLAAPTITPAAVDAFIAAHDFPIVDKTGVTFVYRGEATQVLLRCFIHGLPTAQNLERAPGTDLWLLRIENVVQGPNGPVREFRDFTFQKYGQQVRLVAVDASAGYPTDVAENIDRLLQAPHGRRSTPVDRCLEDGGTGYRFTATRK